VLWQDGDSIPCSGDDKGEIYHIYSTEMLGCTADLQFSRSPYASFEDLKFEFENHIDYHWSIGRRHGSNEGLIYSSTARMQYIRNEGH
jgi:hypothetical protein